MSSPVGCMEVVNTRKIRLRPTKAQSKVLLEWIGSARNSYNYVIDKTNKHHEVNKETVCSLQASGVTEEEAKAIVKNSCTFPSWMELKKKDNLEFWESREGWLKDIPSKCFTEAIKHACDARKQGFKLGSKFSLKFRSRKNPVQSCFIPKSAIKQNIIFGNSMKKITGKKEIKFTEDLPEVWLDSELVLDHGQWFLCVPSKKKIQQVDSQDRVVALDVGVRKFLTFYSEDSCGFVADRSINRITRLSLRLDKVISKLTKSTGKLKKSLIKVKNKIRIKIKNLITELHYKVSNWLVSNFDIIILPYYEVSDMVLKGKRKINNKSVRAMLNFNFYKFSQILDRKMKEIKGGVVDKNGVVYNRVVRVNEAFTSKTQTWDGKVVNVGSKETLKISKGVAIDRDINGARNIFIRALVDSPILRSFTRVEKDVIVNVC